MRSRGKRTFLVESYVPKLDQSTAVGISATLRTAIADLRREGHGLRWLRSFALVEEETYVWMLAAPDVDGVALVVHRAGVGNGHVAEAVGAEDPPAVARKGS